MDKRYYVQKLERREIVLRIVESTNSNPMYITDRNDPGVIISGELISEVRLGTVQNNQLEKFRELTVTELAMLHRVHPLIDPLSNEYGKPQLGNPEVDK